MAAKRPTFGVDHPTVVPTNFDPERAGPVDGDGENDADSEANGTETENGTADVSDSSATVDDRSDADR